MDTQKPDDINQHDWDIALKAISQMPNRPPFKVDVARAIASALSADRVACAKMIVVTSDKIGAPDYVADVLADAILNRVTQA